jgi:hypothetical protein
LSSLVRAAGFGATAITGLTRRQHISAQSSLKTIRGTEGGAGRQEDNFSAEAKYRLGVKTPRPFVEDLGMRFDPYPYRAKCLLLSLISQEAEAKSRGACQFGRGVERYTSRGVSLCDKPDDPSAPSESTECRFSAKSGLVCERFPNDRIEVILPDAEPYDLTRLSPKSRSLHNETLAQNSSGRSI